MSNQTVMTVDEEYCFCLDEVTHPDFKVTKEIIQWLHGNLASLKDDNDNTIFSKVNYGYTDNTIKGFGKKPVADVYLTTVNYNSDFDANRPQSINSAIICYLKGNMNNTYLKACELTDYLLQVFEENVDWREYFITEVIDETEVKVKIVSDTFVRRCELRLIPAQKVYGVLVAFELEHML